MVRISDFDLVKMLRENSKIPNVRIAERFGVTETAIRKRIRKLEEKGIIRKYTIDADPKKLGMKVEAVIGIDTKPEDYLEVIERVKGMDEVIRLCSSSGDHMMMAEVWLRDSNELRRFNRKLKSIEGVTRICPAIINERIKC